MTATVQTNDLETARMSLPSPTWEGREEISTGIYRTAIYVSPRAKRCVVETDSIWQGRNGYCIGTRYTLITDSDTLNRLAGEYSAVGEALEKSGLVTVEVL